MELKIPVFVPEEYLNQNPQFNALLHSLGEKCLTQDGTSQSIAKQLSQTQLQYDVVKQSYIQNSLILETVQEMTREQQNITSRDLRHKDCLSRLSKLLQVAQAQQVLEQVVANSSNTLSKCTFMNTSPEWLQEINDVQSIHADNMDDGSIQQYIIPEIEERLQSKLEAIVGFYEPSQVANNMFHLNDVEQKLYNHIESPSHRSFVSTSQHSNTFLQNSPAAALRREKQLLSEHKKYIQKQTLRVQKQNFKYHQKVWQSLTVITEMVEEFKLSYFAEFDKLTLDWIRQRILTMQKKLHTLKYQYLNLAFNQSSIPILKRMKDVLDNEQNTLQSQLSQVAYELEEYSKVGIGFDQLVEEYSSVLKRIEEKKWQLEELQQHNTENQNDEYIPQPITTTPVRSAKKPVNQVFSAPERHKVTNTYDQELRALLDDDDPYSQLSSGKHFHY
jgi:hypothetical protein